MKYQLRAMAPALLIVFIMTGCQFNPSPDPSPRQEAPSTSSSPPRLFSLDNGLTLIVKEDHSSPVASVQAWCGAGSITEGDHLGAGLSHILEHMLFKGTERRPSSSMAQEIQSLGGYTNAYTTFNRTVYYIDLPSENWAGALDILTDAMFHSTLPEDEYIKEMEVVRREFAMGFDDPRRTIQKLLFAHAFTTHPYQYPVIGYLELFNQLSREDVLHYYKQQYVPNNLTFIVVGNVDADAVYRELERLAGKESRGFLPEPHLPAEPPQLGKRYVEKPFPTDTCQISMAYHIPGITHPDIYALDVLAILAGQGRSSLLHSELVEDRKLLRSIGTYSYTPEQSGLWGGSAIMHPDSDVTPAEIITAIQEILEGLKTRAVTPAQLEKARNQVLADYARQRQTMADQASSLGISWFITRDLEFDQTYLDGIRSVTAADLKRVAQTYLNEQNLTVAVLTPQSDASADDGKTATTAPEASLPQLEKLDDSIPVVLVPDFKTPLVTVQVSFRGGLLAENPENNGISQVLAKMYAQGTRNRSREELAREIESLGGNLLIEAGNSSMTIGVELLEDDLDQGLEILHDIILRPLFSEDALDKILRKQRTDLSLQKDNPMSVASNHLKAKLLGNHPYSMNSLGTEESLGRLTVEDLRRFHESMLRAENTVFSVAGHFDPETIIDQLDRVFSAGEFRGSGLRTHAKSDFQGQGKTHHVATDKVQAIVQLGYPGVSIDSPDYVALALLDEALSDLSSRLFIRIRDKQSLAYFVGTGQLLGIDPGVFIFYAGTRPDASDRVREEFLDEIRLLTTEGLTDQEFERAKATLRGKRLIQNQKPQSRARKAALYVLYGLGIDFEEVFNRTLQSLTREDLLQTAQKYLGEKNFSCIIVQPEQTKAE
jgi:zinc protease